MRYDTFRRFGSTIHTLKFHPNNMRLGLTYGIKNKREHISKIYGEPALDEVTVFVVNGQFFNTADPTNEGLGDDMGDHFINVAFDGNKLILEPDIDKDKKYVFNVGTSYPITSSSPLTFWEDRSYKYFSPISDKNPRMFFGQDTDGYIYFFAADGRKRNEAGLTPEEQKEIVFMHCLHNSANLDGGGSAAMKIEDRIVNKSYDGRGVGSCFCGYKKYTLDELPVTSNKINRTGRYAHLAQRLLNLHGYNLVEDGVIGSKTKKVIKDYQSRQGLAIDGVIGKKTWTSLVSSTPKKEPAEPQCNDIIGMVKSKIGCGYVWGTQGETLTTSLLHRLKNTFGERHFYFPGFSAEKWIGKQCFDCSGLIVWAMRELGVIGKNEDYNAQMLYDKFCYPDTKDELRPGDLCFRKKGSELVHVGVYIGNNKVVHAKGTKHGVVLETLDNSFNVFGRPKFLAHWAEKYYSFLVGGGMVIHQRDFDKPITRGEAFALLARSMGFKE